MLKEKIIRFLIQWNLKKNNIRRINPSFHDSKSIGLLFTWENEEKLAVILDFINRVERLEKKVEWICYYKNGSGFSQQEISFFSKKDFSLFGSAKKTELRTFMTKPFDFLFHLDLKSNTCIRYVLSRCMARCRVGKFNEGEKDYYDFMIHPSSENDLNELCQQMIFYAKNITNNDQN
jgi:hypothetical protein